MGSSLTSPQQRIPSPSSPYSGAAYKSPGSYTPSRLTPISPEGDMDAFKARYTSPQPQPIPQINQTAQSPQSPGRSVAPPGYRNGNYFGQPSAQPNPYQQPVGSYSQPSSGIVNLVGEPNEKNPPISTFTLLKGNAVYTLSGTEKSVFLAILAHAAELLGSVILM